MKLNRLYLRNFRNYSECSVDFAPGINFIHGANAMGKTTLLEAIYLLITGRSFRTHHLADLIKFGEQEFYLEMLFEKSGIEQTLKMHYDGKTRKIIHNATQLASLSGLLGILHGVILTPEDHELVKGLPKTRRHFLDLHIARTNPLYLQHLSRYYKAMKQRNILLRQNERQTIEPFEQVMSESASFLSQTRQQTLDELSRLARHQPEPLTLHYKPSPFVTTQREREYELGLTTSGPHKEDFAIYLGEKPARVFGSEGQQRSCVAALKLAEWRRMAEITEETPLLCVDDVGISFDQKREAALMEHLAELGQVFLTSCKAIELPQQSHQLEVVDGTVQTSDRPLPSSLPQGSPQELDTSLQVTH